VYEERLIQPVEKLRTCVPDECNITESLLSLLYYHLLVPPLSRYIPVQVTIRKEIFRWQEYGESFATCCATVNWNRGCMVQNDPAKITTFAVKLWKFYRTLSHVILQAYCKSPR
jgi:hypothetical protein